MYGRENTLEETADRYGRVLEPYAKAWLSGMNDSGESTGINPTTDLTITLPVCGEETIMRYLMDVGNRYGEEHMLYFNPALPHIRQNGFTRAERDSYAGTYQHMIGMGRDIAKKVVERFLSDNKKRLDAQLELEKRHPGIVWISPAKPEQYLAHMEKFLEWGRDHEDPRWYARHAIDDAIRFKHLGDARGESWDYDTNMRMGDLFRVVPEPLDALIATSLRVSPLYQHSVHNYGEVVAGVLSKIRAFREGAAKQ